MTLSPDPIHTAVREHYAARARSPDACCGDSCCDDRLYDPQLLTGLPSDVANFTLGCGDPISLAQLQPGETVLDLGSGGGLDCFLAARQVGATGRVIGVDMTPEMLERARGAARRLGATNVEFRQGYLESLPVAAASVDVVISNCVINLAPDKPQVFHEIFRVLKPGSRIAISDIVTNGSLPPAVQNSLEAWGACVAGALDVEDYTHGLTDAGFVEVRIQPRSDGGATLSALPIGVPFSAAITARKPEEAGKEPGERIECVAVGGVESRRVDADTLMSRVSETRSIAGGYELRLTGDPAETRAIAEAFIRAEAVCCSFLHFDLLESADGLRLRLTGSPAAMQFVESVWLGEDFHPFSPARFQF